MKPRGQPSAGADAGSVIETLTGQPRDRHEGPSVQQPFNVEVGCATARGEKIEGATLRSGENRRTGCAMRYRGTCHCEPFAAMKT